MVDDEPAIGRLSREPESARRRFGCADRSGRDGEHRRVPPRCAFWSRVLNRGLEIIRRVREGKHAAHVLSVRGPERDKVQRRLRGDDYDQALRVDELRLAFACSATRGAPPRGRRGSSGAGSSGSIGARRVTWSVGRSAHRRSTTSQGVHAHRQALRLACVAEVGRQNRIRGALPSV